MAQPIRLTVLGAGPGGYAAAFYAADLGMQVTLVDEEKNPGGVCLYRGCIPSKALLHVAKVVDEARHAAKWGVTFGEPAVDVDKLRAYKNSVVEKLTGGTGTIAKMRKVNYIQGRATLSGPKSLKVAGASGNTDVAFDYLILATGSHPTRIPTLSLDSPRMLDSTSALDLPDVPKSLLVVGGGYIGLELGSVYATLGSKVSVVEMTPGLLPGADRDLVAVLEKKLTGLFAAIMVNTKVVKVAEEKSGIRVSFEGDVTEKEQVFDRVLVSIGRRPNSKIPGLETTKVKVDTKGFIESDAQRRTAEPSIFVIGDVAGEPMLAHKASHEARVAVEAIAGHKGVRAAGDSGSRLHRPGDRVVRLHRGAGEGTEPGGGDRQVPVGGERTGDQYRPPGRPHQAGGGEEDGPHPRRRPGWLGCRRADLRGGAGNRDGRHG
jgi:dihydrolipoamide dehydrogenase